MNTEKNTASYKKKHLYLILAVELVLILGMLAVLYFMLSVPDKGPKVTILDPGQLSIPDEIVQQKEEGTGTMKGYMNIALFGVDAENDNQLYKGSRSDSTMIASINLDTGDIKLCSIYRDTYLNIGTEYRKCNAAYFFGGAEQAVKMLNSNLDMDIENFITVGYKGLSKIIDGLGGIYIDVDSEELKHINNYQYGCAKTMDTDYIPVEDAGYQLLNGLQATAYCRIRATAGSDFKRTARQREVIRAIEDRAKKQDLATLTKVFNDSIGDIYTSIDSEDILTLLGNISNYHIVEEGGFPTSELRTDVNFGAKGLCIVPTDLEKGVSWLHNFLFDDPDYQVTDTVKEFNAVIQADTAAYRNRTQK